jgi:uncharacterized membrane protein YeaQ/YmgE (transglycosylase-associated protein family)
VAYTLRADFTGNPSVEPVSTVEEGMHILAAIFIGLIVGIIAKLLMPGRDPGGFIITILLGIGGSFLAGWGGREMGWYAEGQPAGFLASVVGAIVILVIYRVIAGRRS